MTSPPSCPSSRPSEPGAAAFGIVGGTAERPRVAYLPRPLAFDDALLELAGAVAPAEVFRFGAPCAEARCQHFTGARCSLGDRVVELLPPVVRRLPRCAIRSSCRWFAENGGAACRRCPAIVTENHAPGPAMVAAAGAGQASTSTEVN